MNKKIIAGIIILIALSFTGYFLVKSKSAEPETAVEEIPTPEAALPTVTDSVKVDLTARNGKKAVDIKIAGIPSDIETIEYELIYMTASGLSKGVVGSRKVADLPLEDITLGSCSSGGKCTYDEGVSIIDLILKFHSREGVSVFRKNFDIT